MHKKKAWYILYQTYILNLVPLAGLEPARLAALDFESSLSTNSNTVAFPVILYYVFLNIPIFFYKIFLVKSIKKDLMKYQVEFSNGGIRGTRTPDPLHVKQMLSQLSYNSIWLLHWILYHNEFIFWSLFRKIFILNNQYIFWYNNDIRKRERRCIALIMIIVKSHIVKF